MLFVSSKIYDNVTDYTLGGTTTEMLNSIDTNEGNNVSINKMLFSFRIRLVMAVESYLEKVKEYNQYESEEVAEREALQDINEKINSYLNTGRLAIDVEELTDIIQYSYQYQSWLSKMKDNMISASKSRVFEEFENEYETELKIENIEAIENCDLITILESLTHYD